MHIFDQDFLDNEHAIQYKKTVVAGPTDLIKEILEAPNPKRVKKIGDGITTNQTWHEMKQGVMYDICWAKAKQHPKYRRALLAANGKAVVEDTSDPYWDQGPDGNGRNVMDILQMALSKELACLEMKPGLTSSQMFNTKPAQLQNSYMTSK